MLQRKKIALIIPIYNEESDIQEVIFSIPDYVDYTIIINDASTDNSLNSIIDAITLKGEGQISFVELSEIESLSFRLNEKPELITRCSFLIHHSSNMGKGAGVKTGYAFAIRLGADCIATIDGDGQMAPNELKDICDPILLGEADYAKGNRLSHPNAKEIIPIVRLIGIYILTFLTRLCSGYWHINDTQSGFTAINSNILKQIDFRSLYNRYGYVNDIIVRLSLIRAKVVDVPITPIYKTGRKSKMNIWITMPKIAWMMIRLYFYKESYKLKKEVKDVKE